MRSDNKKGIISFLLLSFGIAWTVWIGLYLLGIPMGTPIHGSVSMLAIFSPAIAAFITRKYITKEGFSDVGWQLNLKKWPVYIFIFLFPLVAVFGTAFLAQSFGLVELNFSLNAAMQDLPVPEFFSDLNLVSFIMIQILSAIPASLVLFGEEFGWRGYLQNKIYSDSPWKSAVVVGLIWGVWHYPMNLQGFNYPDHRVAGLFVFPAALIFGSYIFGWVYRNTQSIWAVSLAHASFNSVSGSLMLVLYLKQTNYILTSIAGVCGVFVLAAISIGLHFIEKKRQFNLSQ